MKKSNYFLFFIFFFLCNACKKEDDNSQPVECLNIVSEQIVIGELNDSYAYVFSGSNPDTVDENLTPLIDYLGDANFVGMGEATHGTAEFYEMKDKLFRLLVTEKGFKAIIFELPWGNCLKVNDFVTKGEGTADSVIDQTGYWTYDTEEVRTLAQWVHDYNIGLSDDEKIYFVGCDPQGDDFNIEQNLIADYLSKVQPDSLDHIIDNYNNIPLITFQYSDADSTVKNLNMEGTQKVYNYFIENRDLFINASSELEYEIALMATHVIQQREYIYRTANFGTTRDSLMAIYSEWWQRILDDDAKVAIWAHNGHVMDGITLGIYWMGTFLRSRHPNTYKNVGFSFGKGSFNAFLAGQNYELLAGVRAHHILDAPCKTINQVLSVVDGEQNYIIFDELAGPTQAYFGQRQGFFHVGGGFNVTFLDNYIGRFQVPDLLDALIHFDETKASVLR